MATIHLWMILYLVYMANTNVNSDTGLDKNGQNIDATSTGGINKSHIEETSTSSKSIPTCSFYPDSGVLLNETVKEFVDEGTKLLEYSITINGGADTSDLVWDLGDGRIIYRPDRWVRINSPHGKALLSLAYNYQVVSLGMLSFGVERLNISLNEEGCNTTQERVEALRKLIYNDFNVMENDMEYKEVCNEEIKDGEHALPHSTFQEICYRIHEHEGDHLEGTVVHNTWIRVLDDLLEVIRLFILLCGPYIFQSWFFTNDLKSSVPYTVHLENPFEIDVDLDSHTSKDDKHRSELKREYSKVEMTPLVHKQNTKLPLVNLRHTVEDIKDKVKETGHMNLKTKQMNIIVDETKLMAQSSVPVNLFTFFKNEFIGCNLLNRTWSKAWANAGCIFGRWPKAFRMNGQHSQFPPQKPTWGQVLRTLSGLIVGIIIVPLPFHIRVAVYWFTEAAEMQTRVTASNQLGFSHPYFETFWLGIEWPIFVILTYLFYAISASVFVLCQFLFYYQFDDIIQDCICDLREISWNSILNMFFYHLVVPFKEFGFLIGLLVAVPYYIVIMPLALCVAIFYGIPTIYMMGRLFFNFRCSALDVAICCGAGNKGSATDLSGTSDSASVESACGSTNSSFTFTNMFGLDAISPDTRLYPRLPIDRLRNRWRNFGKYRYCRFLMPLSVSFMTVILMLTLVVMYAEAVRFLFHIILLGVSGLILNSSETMDYFILFFWTFMYSIRTLQTIHSKYNQMSDHLFGFFKRHLQEEVSDTTRLPEKYQIHTGFKYFHRERLADIKKKMRKYMCEETVDQNIHDTEDELIRNEKGELVWDVHALVLFVDTQDLAHIPKRLFWKICDELRAPGCPGPLSQSVKAAVKQLIYMLMFLFVIYAIIMSFHSMFDSTSNNQLLLTVASGLLPLIIRQLIPSSPQVDLSEYSLKGKIEEILLHYRDEWRAYDLVSESDCPDDQGTDSSHDQDPDGEPKKEEKDQDPYREDDIEDMIQMENIEVLSAVPVNIPSNEPSIILADIVPELSAARPPGTSSPPTRTRGISRVEEGSTTIEDDNPYIRIPLFEPRERLLTFSTVAGPKESRSGLLQPIVRSHCQSGTNSHVHNTETSF